MGDDELQPLVRLHRGQAQLKDQAVHLVDHQAGNHLQVEGLRVKGFRRTTSSLEGLEVKGFRGTNCGFRGLRVTGFRRTTCGFMGLFKGQGFLGNYLRDKGFRGLGVKGNHLRI